MTTKSSVARPNTFKGNKVGVALGAPPAPQTRKLMTKPVTEKPTVSKQIPPRFVTPVTVPSVSTVAKGGRVVVKRSTFLRKLNMSLDSYTPNNDTIYDAAYAGFMAGVYLGKDAAFAPSYNPTSLIAQAVTFAQAVDTGIATGTPVTGQATFVANLAQSLMANKYSVGLPESAFTGIANVIASLYNDAASGFTETGGGGGSTALEYTQDCSAGGTVSYTGPTPVPPLIILSGDPPEEFTLVLPISGAPAIVTIANAANQGCIIAGGDGLVVVSGAPPVTIVIGFGGTVTVVYNGEGDTTNGMNAQGEPVTWVAQLAGSNLQSSGSVQTVPILGAALNRLSVELYSVTPPTIGAGAQSGQQGNMEWENSGEPSPADLLHGRVALSQTGVARIHDAEATYPNSAQQSQQMVTGQLWAGDTLGGPSTSDSFQFALPLSSTVSITVKFMARITTAGGSQNLGDSYSAVFELVAKCLADGTTSIVPQVEGSPTSNIFADASMTGFVFDSNGNAGGGEFSTLIDFGYTTPSGFNAGVECDIQIHLLECDIL